jgi:hypothetical protein
MPNLTNSITKVVKATYVPLKIAEKVPDVGHATLKSSYVRQLNLQPGEVEAVQKVLVPKGAAAIGRIGSDPAVWSLLKQFEGTLLSAQLPAVSAFANIPVSDLITLGNALVALRQQAVELLQQPVAPAADVKKVERPGGAQSVGAALNLLNTAIIGVKGLATDSSTSPIGMLNLERLEMTPAGVERGGLLATIPLAPKERTAVEQKEWSFRTQEFTSIVTDSLENYSETGVTENTQLSQSTSSQISHSNQYNVNASVSGTIGFVTASVATQFGGQDQNSQSAADSRNHAIQTTRKASSRVKESHKITISTKTVTGTSEATTRTLENPSATNPMRIDYFSLMRRWHVAVYRYGLRLTYDITIPEPGAAMREIYRQLAEFQAQLVKGFSFPLQYSDITPATFADPNSKLWTYANQWGVPISPPPPEPLVQMLGGPIPGLDTIAGSWHFNQISFTVKEGYAISDVTVEVMLNNVPNARSFYVFGSGRAEDLPPNKPNDTYDLTKFNNFMAGLQGNQVITYFVKDCSSGVATFTVTQSLTEEAKEQWAASVWNALYNAAQAISYAQQQAINAQIQALQDQINNVDTLTLRREENDEIMKGVLRWLLGPNFEFMPANVINLFKQAGGDLLYGVNFTGNTAGPQGLNWNLLYQNEDKINFINQAIDWDNVFFFLYSYFWDVPESWDFIREIQHADKTRQAFLRAGSARVVLTVRKGWELAWTYFVEFGISKTPLIFPQHPYLTIAQQIHDYDNTNYPGIPPANPNGGGPVDDDTPQIGTTCATNLAKASSVTIPVADSSGFKVGATAIIDTWESGVQETQPITAVPDATHITVLGLSQGHDASGGSFPIVQAGAKGLLIGEWFEYTPTSGTDIAVTSDLTTIA